MNVMERLVQTDRVFMSRRTYEQLALSADVDARIEAALYRAEVPEKYFRALVPQLRDVERVTLATALFLYERLDVDPRLDAKSRVNLIPQLVEAAKLHGAKVFLNDSHVEGIVQTYLDMASNGRKNGVHFPQRTEDRHASMKKIPYGSEIADVVYGERVVRPYRDTNHGADLKGRRNFRIPPKSLVEKANELSKAVSSPAPNWEKAIELLDDLTKSTVPLYQNRSFYRNFLDEMATIIRRELQVTARIIYDEGLTDKASVGITVLSKIAEVLPIGYEILPPRTIMTKPQVTKASRVYTEQDYINRRPYKKPVSASHRTIPGDTRTLVELRQPHPRLSKALAAIRI